MVAPRGGARTLGTSPNWRRRELADRRPVVASEEEEHQVKAHEIKIGMRYRESDEEMEIDSRVADVEHLLSGKTLLVRGVIVTLEDGSVIQWMDPNREVPEVS